MDPPQNQCQYFIRKLVQWRWWKIDNITPQKVFCLIYIDKIFEYLIYTKRRNINIDMILFTLFYIVENRADNVIYYLFILFLSIVFIRILLLLFI